MFRFGLLRFQSLFTRNVNRFRHPPSLLPSPPPASSSSSSSKGTFASTEERAGSVFASITAATAAVVVVVGNLVVYCESSLSAEGHHKDASTGGVGNKAGGQNGAKKNGGVDDQAKEFDMQASHAYGKLKHLYTMKKEWECIGQWLRYGKVTYNTDAVLVQESYDPHIAGARFKRAGLLPEQQQMNHHQGAVGTGLTGAGVTSSSSTYEIVERTTRKGDIDAVEIIPILKVPLRDQAKEDGDFQYFTVLVVNYRPPVGKPCIEFPAGLIDDKETPEKAALREMKEETGFKTSKIASTSNVVYCDPAKSNENMKFVEVEMEEDLLLVKKSVFSIGGKTGEAGSNGSTDERIGGNKTFFEELNRRFLKPQGGSGQELDKDEHIEVLVVPLNGLRARLDKYNAQFGFTLDAKLYSFAKGMELQQKLNL
eukprot:Nk52_evm5s759 gene=Nk52_evmTU5s759